jgi:putative tryptophan/tyrosine transport system substrate-binding protein
MRRRDLIKAFAGATINWPLAARAQIATVRRIGLLSPFTRLDAAPWNQAFLKGLRDLGWIDGKNITFEYRYSDGNNDRLPALIADLIRLKVDIIVTSVTNDTLAAKNATTEIPIVMAAAGDPVATGIVGSLARPGGNITGLSQMNPDLTAKRLEVLKEIAPGISFMVVLLNPEDPISALGWKEIQLAAKGLGIAAQSVEIRNTGDLEKNLAVIAKARFNALAIMPNPVFVTNLKSIADFALQNRLPSMFHLREFVDVGGLVSYGVDRSDLYRRAATYVDKILKGASPADLPIEQPTKFDLAVNVKTAKALGLTVPPSLRVLADEVIE